MKTFQSVASNAFRAVDALNTTDKNRKVLHKIVGDAVQREHSKIDFVGRWDDWEFVIGRDDNGSAKPLFFYEDGDGSKVEMTPQKHFINSLRAKEGGINMRLDQWEHALNHNPSGLEGYVNDWMRGDLMNKSPKTFRSMGQEGQLVARSAHGPTYAPIDDLYLIENVLTGVAQSGMRMGLGKPPEFGESRTILDIQFPEMKVDAKHFLQNYEPVGGKKANSYGIIAGFSLVNSEVGYGSIGLMPSFLTLVCTNGMVGYRSGNGFKRSHRSTRNQLGFSFDPDVRAAYSQLVGTQVRAAVKKTANRGNLEDMLVKMGALAEAEIVEARPAASAFARAMDMSEANGEKLYEEFVQGRDMSAMGLVHAATSMARSYSGEDRFDVETKAYDMVQDQKWVKSVIEATASELA